MKKIGLIGVGSWGTVLAITLAGKGHEVRIWNLNETPSKIGRASCRERV